VKPYLKKITKSRKKRAQVVECLAIKCKALSLSPSIEGKKNPTKEQKKQTNKTIQKNQQSKDIIISML
jgi:hypothetical protein